MTSTSSPMHSGAFNFESKFQNNLFTLRMAIQCRPKFKKKIEKFDMI